MKMGRNLLIISTIILVAYVALAIAPYASLHWVKSASPKRQQQVNDVLQAYGTFGDMFGALNVLVSGFALVFAIYAVMLQRHDIKQGDADRRETAMIAVIGTLAQTYTFLYASNPEKYDAEYKDAPDGDLAGSKKYTVKGFMLHYTSRAQDHALQLRDRGHLAFTPLLAENDQSHR
jgi:hypothetical protein